jgi:hypothetical protein
VLWERTNVRGSGLIEYWCCALVLSALAQPAINRFTKANAADGFVLNCLVVSAVCGLLNFASTLLGAGGEFKPGWAAPFVAAGAVAAFPATLVGGLLFYLGRACAARFAARAAKRYVDATSSPHAVPQDLRR